MHSIKIFGQFWQEVATSTLVHLRLFAKKSETKIIFNYGTEMFQNQLHRRTFYVKLLQKTKILFCNYEYPSLKIGFTEKFHRFHDSKF